MEGIWLGFGIWSDMSLEGEMIHTYRVFLALVALIVTSCGASSVQPTSTALPTASPPPPQTPTTTSFPGVAPTPLLVPADTATPQAQEVSLELKPTWIKGDTRQIEIVKQRTKTDQSGTKTDESSRTDVEITVLDAGTDGYVLRWKFGETTFDNPALASDPMVSHLAALNNGLSVEYETDQTGSFLQLRNWQEVKAQMENALNLISEQMEKSGISGEVITPLREQIQTMFSTKEQVEAFALREVQLYHLPFGITYQSGHPIEYENLVPYAFGDPFPAHATFVLEEYDSVAAHAVIRWSQAVDPEEGRRILLNTLTELARQGGAAPPKEQDLPAPFSIEDANTYVVDTSAGWILSLEYSRTTAIGPGLQVDSTKIVQKTR
jgi:hypothetical protein